jgi:hypothetical protein
MPETRLKCPSCGAVLKLAAPLAPGKAIKCPKCAGVIRPSADGGKTAGPTGANVRPGPRPQPARKGRPEEPPAEDAEDIEEEESPQPKKRVRRAVDEEEEQPRKRKKKRDEEGQRKKLLWIGIGGGLVVAAAVVLIVVLGSGKPAADRGKDNTPPGQGADGDRSSGPGSPEAVGDRKRVRENAPIKVSPEELNRAFSTDRANASRTYKNKVLEVRAVVRQVRRDHLTLDAKNNPHGMVCRFQVEDQDPLATVRQSTTITVRGIGGVDADGEPVLRSCLIKENEAGEKIPDSRRIQVTAEELTKALEESDVSSREKFGNGKPLLVTGIVERLQEMPLGGTGIRLQGHRKEFAVVCGLSNKADAAALKPGQTIRLRGDGRGRMLVETNAHVFQVNDCELVK